MLSTSLGLEAGVPAVRQRADAAEADRLRARAERLAEAEHPGVVRVLRSRPHGDGWEVVTEHGGPSLAAITGPTSVRRLAALLASVAATVGDLHERGIVHGRIDATHVLVGRQGRPQLCGFAPPGRRPADDVAALGAVLAEQLDSVVDEGGSLRAVAAAAQAELVTRRPSARRLAAELDAAGAPRGIVARPARIPGARARRSGALAAGIAVVALLGVARAHRPDRDPTAAPAATPQSASADTTPTAGASCVARTGRPLSPAACGRSVTVEGPAVLVDGRRYVVGLPGDEVAVGDWGCSGELRAAVLRPDSGEVLVLAPFPSSGAPAVERAERIPGARSLDVREPPDGCPTLGVLGP